MTRGLALDTFNKLDLTADTAAPLVKSELTPTPDVKFQCWLLPVSPAFGACVPPTPASPPPRPGRGRPVWASPGLLAVWPGPRCTRLARVGTVALIPALGEGLVGQGPRLPAPSRVNCPSHQQAQPVPRLQLRQKARCLLLDHLQTVPRASSQEQRLQRPVEAGVNPFPAVVGTLWS